jgi:hypothetical protein
MDSRKGFAQLHVGSSVTALIEDPTVQVIVPLRFPYHCYITRTFRAKKIGAPPVLKGRAAAMWQRLIRECAQGTPIFLPVDAGLDRRVLLDSVVAAIGAPIVDQSVYDGMLAQWPMVGTRGPQEERIEYDKTGLIHGETPDFLNFAVEWYEGIISSLKALQ